MLFFNINYMGLFGTTIKYSREEKQLSAYDIKRLTSHIKVRSLESSEENIVENALIARRHGDGKISLEQIYKELTKLKNQNKISRYDRDGLMKVFQEHFGE